MTDAEKILLVKSMIESEDTNEVLESYLLIAGQSIINRAYPYDSTQITVPVKYHALQCKIAAYLLNKRGAEGETSHSENGISRSYESADIPPSMLSEVTPYCGVL